LRSSREAAELAGGEIAGGELLAAAADPEVERGAREAGTLGLGWEHDSDGLELFAGLGVAVDDTVTDGSNGFTAGNSGAKTVDRIGGCVFSRHQRGE